MSAWNDDRIQRLKILWLEGRTAEWIARDLGAGITRSAVLGKVHRLRLSEGRGPTSKPKPPHAPRRPQQPFVKAVVERAPPDRRRPETEPPEPPPAEAKSILTVRRLDCRWPYGDPGDADFCLCGRRVARGSFCQSHAARAYRGPAQTPETLMWLAALP